jgi:hypothetical protein
MESSQMENKTMRSLKERVALDDTAVPLRHNAQVNYNGRSTHDSNEQDVKTPNQYTKNDYSVTKKPPMME